MTGSPSLFGLYGIDKVVISAPKAEVGIITTDKAYFDSKPSRS